MALLDQTETLQEKTRQTLDRLRRELLDERTSDGHWEGELSPSALSTATAISAMAATLVQSPHRDDASLLTDLIGRGMRYLRDQQNDDGGYGDTDRSHSNIATSYLVLAASSLAGKTVHQSLNEEQTSSLESYIQQSGELEGLRRRYGKDKTFVVPIMTNLAIAGLVDWDEVAALPFEAAVFPQSMYRFLGMPVVSYAIPALVAIGQARHFHGRRSWFAARMIRSASIAPSLRVLRRMQPESGGYLEATPLTSFVVMSLAATGRDDLDVAKDGLRFLKDSVTAEGSWPIDTNLATWVTSLSIHALASDPQDDGSWCIPALTDWHLGCQHVHRHPFTGAEPGGWGWSDLSGAVPDSDDTPAAILALEQIRRWVDESTRQRIGKAIDAGKGWLLKLQNRDGGWPTFCRGWGKLPFDRSSTDLTGHAMRAMHVAGDSDRSPASLGRAQARARRFLEAHQRQDGSWVPLWFGNQDLSDESNPIYGTARVLLAAASVQLSEPSRSRGGDFLVTQQNPDGGWGGGPSLQPWLESTGFACQGAPLTSSIEETALAVDALATHLMSQRNLSPGCGVEGGEIVPQNAPLGETFAAGGNEACRVAIIRGIQFLLDSVDDGRHRVPWPIGFYFAKLWYHERLYPLIFTVAALGKYLRLVSDRNDPDWPR